jgi:hypothetical protein
VNVCRCLASIHWQAWSRYCGLAACLKMMVTSEDQDLESQSKKDVKKVAQTPREKIKETLHGIFNSAFVSSEGDVDSGGGHCDHHCDKVEKKKSMKLQLLDYEVTEVETDEELKPNQRKIQVKSTIDYLLTTEVINFKTPLFVLVEVLKAIIFGVVTIQNIDSCAKFSPYVLLVSGLFIFPQIAVLWNGKLMKLFQILSYDMKDDKNEFKLVRGLAVLGMFFIEVLFAVATFWYMNTLTDVISGVTSGLTMMVISNFDTVLLSQITVYTTAYKTNTDKLEKFFGYIYYSQYFFVVFFSGLLYVIAISVATSNHSGYQSSYCDDTV